MNSAPEPPAPPCGVGWTSPTPTGSHYGPETHNHRDPREPAKHTDRLELDQAQRHIAELQAGLREVRAEIALLHESRMTAGLRALRAFGQRLLAQMQSAEYDKSAAAQADREK